MAAPPFIASEYLILTHPSAQFIGIVFGLSIGGAIFINQALKALRVILPTAPESDLRRVISGKFGMLLFPYGAIRNTLKEKSILLMKNSGTSSGILDQYSPELRARALTAIVHSLRQL